MPDHPVQTVVQAAREQARRRGDKVAYVNLRDGREEQRSLTYGQLDESCRRIGAALQRRDAVGRRILLLFPQGAEFVTGFLGTLYAGAIAVPAHTPKPAKRSWTTFEAIVADCRPAFVLTCRSLRDNIAVWARPYPSISALELLCIEDLEAESPAQACKPWGGAPADIAFLQYTSGSTSAPKGVMVSHANLIHNAALTARHLGHDETTVIVSWLPLFHDLGLIGIVIQSLYVGATCYMMSPAAFSGNPALWLQAIGRYRATTALSSDFGYRLCTKAIRAEQMEGIDLGCWRNALNAAEPIHAATLRGFQERFGPYGFAPDAFLPAYGLAEATLLSTTSRVGEAPVIVGVDRAALAGGRFVPAPLGRGGEVVEVVSSGRPSDDMAVEIVDPDSALPCAEGRLGEVWVSGASVAQGYWGAEEATARVFRQSPADRRAPEFLRTGDLGFRWHGELFIAGRLKDLMIVRGRNIYPQDVELTIKDCHPAFRTVNGAAFAIDADDGEAVVAVHEVERAERNAVDLGQLERVVRDAVWREHDITLADVVLIRPASLPKTTSGKVQRRLAAELYRKGELSIMRPRKAMGEPSMAGGDSAVGASGADIAAWILRATRALIGGSVEGAPEDTFGVLGLDSVHAARLAVVIGQTLGRPVDITAFWDHPTPAALAKHLAPHTSVPRQPPPQRAGRSRDDLIGRLEAALDTAPAGARG